MIVCQQEITCILFDLDGTLADTAPDLVATLYQLCDEDNRPRPDFQRARNCASDGSRGLINLAFNQGKDAQILQSRVDRFLDIYASLLTNKTELFEGVSALLANIQSNQYSWGIITNKPSRFTEPVVKYLCIDRQAACIVSSDTTAHSKPHPEPMLYAASTAGVQPENCLYVGDAPRDIEAGKAAGMKTAVAQWGYIEPHVNTQLWGADILLPTVEDLSLLV